MTREADRKFRERMAARAAERKEKAMQKKLGRTTKVSPEVARALAPRDHALSLHFKGADVWAWKAMADLSGESLTDFIERTLQASYDDCSDAEKKDIEAWVKVEKAKAAREAKKSA